MVETYTYNGLIDEKPPWNVEEVKFADDVTVIRRHAFEGCSKLKKVVIPNTVTKIEAFAFFECTDLSSVVTNVSLQVIGFQTFMNCFNLKQLILLNGLKEIHHEAFGLCHSLKSIFIPESLKTIGNCAFMVCDSLKYVVLMTSEKQITPEDAFFSCMSLERIIKVSKESVRQKLSVIAKYPVGYETMERLLDIDCKGVQCTNAERLYPFMAQACISNLEEKYDADHISSIYCLLRRDPSFCLRY